MRVCVLTLYSGENEFERMKESVAMQQPFEIEHIVFSWLSNIEAHRQLNQKIIDNRSKFDYFVKLDSDMILSDEKVIANILNKYFSDKEIDHLELAVWDFLSQSWMMGCHFFSPRVHWEWNDENLFVDPSPMIEGKRKKIKTPDYPLIIHAPDPHPSQAFQIGVHRAAKAIQSGRKSVNLWQIYHQWLFLSSVWRCFRKHRDKARAFTILGADNVISGRINLTGNATYKDDYIRGYFEEVSDIPPNEVYEMMKRKWDRLAFGHVTSAIMLLKQIASRINPGRKQT